MPERNCHCTSEQSKPPFTVAVRLVVSSFSQISTSSILIVIEGSGVIVTVTASEFTSSQPTPSTDTMTLKSVVSVNAPVS